MYAETGEHQVRQSMRNLGRWPKRIDVNSRNQPAGNVLNAALNHWVIDGRDAMARDEDGGFTLAVSVCPTLGGAAVLR
jgi:hypothetical protein